MTSAANSASLALKQSIKDEARRLGFILAGVTTPDPPPHASAFENWISAGSTRDHALSRRNTLAESPQQPATDDAGLQVGSGTGDPLFESRNECPEAVQARTRWDPSSARRPRTRGVTTIIVCSPKRLEAIVQFIENEVGHPVSSRAYTDSGPILERDLAQRAGLGWIGKNTCLINPKMGSYVLLAEIFLDVDLEPDVPFRTDHCGTCTRCIEACPTACILPDRTLDSSRCISYLTIELREEIASSLRPLMGNWVFGCDICQMVCPWNCFAPQVGDMTFGDHDPLAQADLTAELGIGSGGFSRSDSERHPSPARNMPGTGEMSPLHWEMERATRRSPRCRLPPMTRSLSSPNTRRGHSNASEPDRSPMFRLLIGTRNKGKIEEIRALLQDLPLELVSPEDSRCVSAGGGGRQNIQRERHEEGRCLRRRQRTGQPGGRFGTGS